jgi:hypothetical protein
MTKGTRAIDDAIRAAAKARGYADAAVARQYVHGSHQLDAGEWLVLSVRFKPGTDWEVIGRRRSRGELLQLLEATPKQDRIPRVSNLK